ncbi:MFS transporter [Enterococcus hulanensis]|uniref:MFS transporter n=1 Tax=Enterococcus hulanensis TaxID=2559929 RepID=A0ABU3EUB7_9ENTE|nr:MFS transporter [Enterococcus hulanensis]MDT2598462.1 MFS transporter [Enterococcus hulanensis]MDT2608033.1 MFS transporter [Enterococcus hulanensis]MDT2615328.1 MFS transporter [Enterococcus hulanensis]MDT2626701.1 MFS transporter [Enterococcus hulanensis]MDT2654400.1 MFS transporter [Enterococcus hulanensis]
MNKKKISLAVGILSMNLLLMSGTVVGAAIAAISKSFPQEPISKVQMLSSIPQLGQLAATLVFTWLTYKLTRKNIGVVSVAIVAISGLLPVFYNSSLNIILACMVALGFGLGLISNVGPVLLQEHFDGEERATVMGWAVGFNNLGMMGFTAIGGMLGSANWKNLFWVYGAAIIILLVVLVLVPKDRKLSETEVSNQKNISFGKTVKSLNGYVYVMLIVTFVTSLCLMIFLANQSLLLATKGNGTAYTAMVTALGNVGGICTAFGLKYIRKLTKTDTMAWGFVAFALSYICIVFFNNPVLHIAGNMFSGMGIVMVNATIPYELSILANHQQFPVAIAMNTLIASVAGFLAPMLLAATKISAGANSYIAGIVISGITAAVLLITRLGSRIEKKSEQETNKQLKEFQEA